MKKSNLATKRLWSLFVVCCLMTQIVWAQVGTITGKVIDKAGEGVIGASVLVVGTTMGTITDVDGNFKLDNVRSDATLKISFVGYQTLEVKVAGKKSLTITLQDDTQALDEVVVVGYGVQRKSDLTGAVASVKADDILKNTPTNNIENALQGRMAGVSIVSASGDPTQGATIRVRGANSIKADGGPLVVVDGFIGGTLSMLNPGDIESVEVLKDASATAVYGSRGANGVILITTKKGKSGKVNVNYNGYVNFKKPYTLPDVLSPGQMADLANDYGREINRNSGLDPQVFYDVDAVKGFYNGGGYDYLDAIFRDVALEHTHELSVTGGNEKTQFVFSGRYNYNEGTIEESQRKLINARLKVDTELLPWLKAGVNFNGSYSKDSGVNFGGWQNTLVDALNFPNTVLPKDEDGAYHHKDIQGGRKFNPMAHINEVDKDGYYYSSTIQGYVDVTILKGLTLRTTQNFWFGNTSALNTNTKGSLSGWNSGYNSATFTSTQNYSWTNQNILSYVKEFNKNHRINATAVIEQQYSNNMNNKSEGRELISEEIGANNTSLAKKVYGSSGHTRSFMLSYMARVNYVLMNRYMLTASWRYDGSSNLSSEKRWEQFPSMALAWNMKEESFLRDVDFLSQLKLRAGYGETGNQAVAAYSAWTELEATRDANDNLTLTTKRIGTKGLRWERTKQWNAGIDFGVFNNRLTFTVDVYDKLTKDALLDVTAPLYTGFKTRLKNAAEIRNKGFEVTIGADPVATRDFRWNTNITLSHNKGVIESLDGDLEYAIISGGYQNDYFRNIKGEKLGTMWGYVSDGVWKTSELADAPQGTEAGSYRYKNLDGSEDKQITVEDQTIIGNGQPSFQWGWNNTLTYKNFDLSLFVIGVHGFDIYNYTRAARLGVGDSPLELGPNPEWLNRWTPENENSDIAGFISKRNSKKSASQYVEKGDFVKVKSITLGYNFPELIVKCMKISTLRIYASIQNSFLFTGYSGIDPEVTLKSPLTSGIDYGYYPNGRNYLIGLNFGF